MSSLHLSSTMSMSNVLEDQGRSIRFDAVFFISWGINFPTPRLSPSGIVRPIVLTLFLFRYNNIIMKLETIY